MTTREIHNTLFPVSGLDIQAITSNTTTLGNIIDLSEDPGYNSAEINIFSGDITDGTFTPVLEHGDDPGLSDAADVPDDELTNLESTAVFTSTDDNVVKRLGYIGGKRFIRLKEVSTGVSSGGTLSAIVVRGHARNAPVPGNS